MIKLVVFDWNGTILDDVEETLLGANAVFRYFKVPELSREEFTGTFEVPIWKHAEKVGIPKQTVLDNPKKIADIFSAVYEPLEDSVKTRDGMEEVLQWLNEEQIRAIVLSNHPHGHIVRQLGLRGIEGHFTDVLGALKQTNIYKKKDKKERLAEYLEAHNIAPSEVIIVGDTAEEPEVAQSLGLRSACIRGGYYSDDRLEQVGADFIMDNMRNFIGFIQKEMSS